MQPAPAECRECKILEGRYRADLKVYIQSVKKLGLPLGNEGFEETYSAADLAKRAFEAARDALRDHRNTCPCARLY
jgi:hypothetical protein